MTDKGHIELKQEPNGIIVLTIQLGQNAIFATDMAKEFEDKAYELEDNYNTFPVIITADGSFGAGTEDQFWLGDAPNNHEYHRFEKALAAIERHKNITIAAITGQCSNAMLNLALACDLRVAAANSTFSVTYLRSSQIPDMLTWRLPKYIGLGRAREMIMTEREIIADEAMSIGLITCINENPLLKAKEILQELPPPNATATSVAKRLLNEAYSSAYQNALGNCLAGQAKCLDKFI
ncbi:MAG: enoyl-CoA hydratase/isomerase family protein [bacterium]|nr:enoyl-CoA hydratase/isomerase family protein [bacterium]